MLKNIYILGLFALLTSPAYATDLVNFDSTGAGARVTFAADDVLAVTATQPLTVPQGALYATVMIKGGTHGLESGDTVAGAISNASVFISMSHSSVQLDRLDDADIDSLPSYHLDETNAAYDEMPHSTGAGIGNYGLYQVPLIGAKFMSISYSINGSANQNTIIIDFNEPPQ